MKKSPLWLAASLLLSLSARGGEIADSMRQAIQPQLPAPIVELVCPETAAETKDLFWCSGALKDGRWLHIQAQRKANGNIDILETTLYPAAAEALRQVARGGVTSDFASMACPPDAAIHNWNFECVATLTDGSHVIIDAQRHAAGQIAMEPFLWDPSAASPLIRALRAKAGAKKIDSIRCPYELSSSFDCTVRYVDASELPFRVRRSGDVYQVTGTTADAEARRRMYAWLAIAAGALLVVSGGSVLIALNVRSAVARVPFGPQQEIDLPSGGSYVLHLIAPYFAFVPFWRNAPQYSLADAASGRDVPMMIDLFPSRSSFAKVRRSVRLFRVDRAGRYILRATLPQPRDTSQWELLVSHGFLFRGFVCVFAMIAGFVLIFGGSIAL